MITIQKISAALCISTISILIAGPKKEIALEDLKKIITGNVTRTFSKSNLYAYRSYKDLLNKYKNSDHETLANDIKEQLALAKREKTEADNEVPGWNSALREVDKFVQMNSGSKKGTDYLELTSAMSTIQRENDKLINAITHTNNIFFGGDRNTVFGSTKEHEDRKWEFMYIRNNLDALIAKLQAKTFDTPGKKEVQEILLFTAKYLKASALKASNDMVAEMGRRTKK